jgi:putative MATE family efflux protein
MNLKINLKNRITGNKSKEITASAGKPVSLMKLVWPIFIELILTMLVGNVDQYMVSDYSENAVAAIGNANQIINLLVIMFTIISMSTTIVVSQYIGSNSKHKLSIIYTLSVFVSLVFSSIIIMIILLFTDTIFHFMKVPEAILQDASTYLRLIGGFIFLQGLNATFSAIFKSNKLMKDTMLISVFINIINVIGNAILIYGFGPIPAMGVAGSAHATNISRLAGAVLYIIIFTKNFDTKISLKALKPFPLPELKKLLRIGFPSAGENFSYSMAMTFILKTINTFGTYVINTKVLASTFAWFSYLYASAVGQASQVIIGNYMGAGEIDQVDKRVMKTLRNAIMVAIVMALAMYLSSRLLFGLFSDDLRVIELGKKIMMIEIILEIGKCSNITLVRSLQATGDTKFPMLVGIISMWSVAFGLGTFLAVACKMGLVGIWIGMALDEDIRAVIFFFRWKLGKWKYIRLAND